ncbi:hypothetical protein ACFO9E_25695 [Streptomyces maoxianensis]|uniref:Uncharacterized protein n=1 Tax=Streptomyces maoxianensis TaxID=1459942 RepID=A0ABV9GEY2_9ACTN
MSAMHNTLRDAVAVISGCLADPEPALDKALDSVLEDLQDANPMDIVAAFAGITLGLVEDLAHGTPDTREDYWQGRAARLSAHITEMENNHE